MRCVVQSPAGYYQHADGRPTWVATAAAAKVFATLPRGRTMVAILARNRVRAEVVPVDRNGRPVPGRRGGSGGETEEVASGPPADV